MISKKPTPVNEFSPELWSRLHAILDQADRDGVPKIAAFDADNTCWDSDAGETFFDWQIHNSGLPGLPADPWARYKELKKPDPRIGYVWLAQISAGQTLAQVRAWATRCLAQVSPWPVYQSQKKLIAELHRRGYEVFIVTASIKWAVEPFAALVGVDFDHVLGIETEVVGDIVTDRPVLPMTWREGKAEGLLKRTGGVRPVLACGNTLGDTAMLALATHAQLAVCTQDRPSGLFDEETKLWVEARERGWLTHAFRNRGEESQSAT
ncbi:MAG: haloacid dehalogenase-like hydrolase [Bdellovibrionota bacterium]